MQRAGSRLVLSATDLVGFLACEHLTNLDLAALTGLVKKPHYPDPELDLLAKRGLEHERRFLEQLRAKGLQITDLSTDHADPAARIPPAEAAAKTAEAARRGDQVIYQATLFDGRWLGYADFLVRVETPSDFGPWSYEVYDTKLARKTEAKALIQLCLYSDLLAALQGVAPKWMHVALGGRMGTAEAHRVTDYEAYYRLVKRQFEAFVTGREPVYPPATRPEPVEHCEVCRWSVDCQRERRRVDDLSLVAGITGQQRRGLREKEVPTRTSLAELPVPLPWTLDRSSSESLLRVHHQARIQVEGEREGRMRYELLEPKRREDKTLEPGMGLLSLPEPTAGDLFFDMEGDPFAFGDQDQDGGFDYLFGIVEPGLLDAEGAPTFHAFWARDAHGAMTLAGEKRAFERTIDLFMERLERNPNLHIYHYAPYEPAAVGRLMGRHATREDEVDRLLRGGVFVDLYRAVKQGLRASVESYSIKKLEPLYGFERTVELRDAGSSLVAFSTWLQDGGEDGGDPELLARIEGYNGDDCRSNWKLRDWLEERRAELEGQLGKSLHRPTPETPDPPEDLAEHLVKVKALEARLTAEMPDDVGLRTEPQKASWLLAQLLSWHRRENKSAYWRYFHLLNDLTDDERVEEPEPIGGLSYVGPVGTVARSTIHRYRFPPQEHEVRADMAVKDPATKNSAGRVVAIDNEAGTLDLKRSRPAPHPTSIVPESVYRTKAQQESLLRVGEWVAPNGLEGPGSFRAARELLLRQPPRVGQEAGASLNGLDETAAQAARRLGLLLEASCLAIQGPPGSGKSTTAGDMIVDLVLAGKRIGVTANSHKVVGNLLNKVSAAAAKRACSVRLGQKPKENESCTCPDAHEYSSNESVLSALQGGTVDVVGGTTWLWSAEPLAEAVDVLFVDEAGQMSLANVVAASQAGTSLVLLGDPQQLDQPVKGSHPPGAERSALAHLLQGHSTMPPELGLFLEKTWRLHPDLCAYTSEAFYDGLLQPEAICGSRNLFGSGFLSGTGLRFLPTEHQGNGKSSEEEAAAVARIVGELLASGATWINEKAETAALALENVLIITPYNAQVRAITAALPGCHVGTVDKFQGQEAPIAIYSMASSSAADAPRGMEFLYSLHRLNVATSRAQCLAVVVASPELLRAQCRTPRQMRLANALCRFVERASPP